MPPANYDPSTYLYWYRKLARHPDREANALAEAFCGAVASWLGIKPPKIYWFEETSFGMAKEAWKACGELKNPRGDPLKLSCDYFRWPRDQVHLGAAGY